MKFCFKWRLFFFSVFFASRVFNPLTNVACFCIGAESFRVPRQVDEEEQGTITKLTDTVKSYYAGAVNTASDYLEQIKGLKLEEKAK